MKPKTLLHLAIAAAMLLPSLPTFALTPSALSPEVVRIDVRKGERCTKTDPGAMQCRGDGPCVQVGAECHSCTAGYQYSDGKCLRCPDGSRLNLEEQGRNWSYTCK
jgi:hypothetical protein